MPAEATHARKHAAGERTNYLNSWRCTWECAEGGARLPDIDVGGAADADAGLALYCSKRARFPRARWAAPWSWWRLLWRSSTPVVLAEFPLVLHLPPSEGQ